MIEYEKEYAQKYYEENKTKIAEYQKQYRQTHRQELLEKARAARTNPLFKEKQAQYYKEWYRLHGRKRTQEQLRKGALWKKKHPEWHSVHTRIHYWIKKGKIKRPHQCEICKSECKPSGHHKDYNFPFDLLWVCASCYKKIYN